MEKEFIAWLRQQATANHEHLPIGLGDDAAVCLIGDQRVVVAVDSIADGTHFDSTVHSLALIGRKAVAVNLSDIAAMGAAPQFALLDCHLPRSFSLAQAQELFGGASDVAREFGVQIIGGDTNTWGGDLVLGVTVIGRAQHALWPCHGAKPGDSIVVSGEFGGSLLGHHLEFEPRCRLAQYIAGRYRIDAATDVSDSLSLDLHKICELSGCGGQINLDQVPVSHAAEQFARQRGEQTALEHALYDGEDFELILAVPADVVDELMGDRQCNCDLKVIGRFSEDDQVLAKHGDGSLRRLPKRGYTH